MTLTPDLSLQKQQPIEPIHSFIVYFHSHGSCRQEGRFLLSSASSRDSNLCLVDMRGSGESNGKFTTLGVKESTDILFLLRQLQTKFRCQSVLLYGRSMGAASLMKFVVENKSGEN